MKKFMIFLLMAFLYLGTCQARSEASHPNDGKLKLLSWVSPTPSQSFLTRSDAAAPLRVDETIVYSVFIVGAEMGCYDQSITLTAVVDGPVTGAAAPTYLWKIDGTAAPGVNDTVMYQFTPSSIPALADGLPHEFTVEVKMQNCEISVSPVHPFQMLKTVGVVSGPAMACANEDLTLTATIDPALSFLPSPATVVAWKWFQGGATYPYATTSENTITLPQSVVSATPGNWEVEPVFASGFSCPVTPRPTSSIWNYSSVVEKKVKGALTLARQDGLTTPVCEGSQLVLKANNTIEPDATGLTLGDVTYEWYLNGQLVATTTTDTYTAAFDNAGNYTYFVKAIYENYDCSEIKSGNVTITVKATPALAIVGDNVICAGQTSNLLTATTGFESYTWLTPSGASGTGANQLHGTDPGHYVVTATTSADNGSCTATADFTVYQFGGDLQVSATDYYVCPGEVVALNANLEGWSNENIQYSWTTIPSGVTVQGATNSSVLTVLVNSDATGTQQFKVKATANGIANCEIERTINVNVIDATMANLTASLDKSNICEGAQVTATAKNGSATYAGLVDWYVNGIQVPGEHAAVMTMNLDEAGHYTVAATPINTVCAAAAPATSSLASVDVYAAPEVAITGNNVICNGAATTITAQITPATAPVGTYSYAWVGPKNGNNSSISADEPGVYAFTVSNATTGCSTTAEFTVQQFGADLQVYASEQDVCPNTSVMLNANLDGFGNENVQYTWSGTGISSGTHGSTITVNPTATTTYTVTAATTAYEQCTMSSTITVNVISETAANPSVSLLTSEHICQGDMASAKAELTSSEVAPYFTWYLNGIEIPGQNLATVSLNLPDTGTFLFSAKADGYQCVTGAVQTADKAFKVHAAPEVTITGNNVVCNGDTAILTPNIVPASGEYTVTWAGPNVATVDATSHVLKTTDAGVYTVSVKDNTSNCMASADITVNVFGADLQLTANQTNICLGETVVLNANLNGFNNENVEYAWTGDGLSAIATGSMVSATPTASGAQKYVVTATAGNCEMKDSVMVNVTAGTVYTTTVTRHNGSEYCEGQQNAYFTASSSPALANALYTWYLDGVEMPGENRNNLFLNGIGIGAHYLAATVVVDGCNSATMSSTVNFNVHAAPEVTITGNNVICNGDTAVLTATATTMAIHPATSNSYTYTYAWSNSETTPTIKVTENGTYTVTVTNHITRSGVTYDLCSTIATIEVSTFGGNIQMTVDKNAICLGETVVLNANLNGFNNENIEYAWTGNGLGTIATGSQVSATPDAAGAQKYIVTASAGNCEMKDSLIVNVSAIDTLVTNLTFNQPYSIYGLTNAEVCQGTQIEVWATTTDSHGSTVSPQYTWYMDGFELPGENMLYLDITMNNPGNHYFFAKPITEGCVYADFSNELYLNVQPTPVVTLSGDHYYTTDATSATIVAAVSPAGDYAYEWSNGEIRNNADHDTLIVGTPGGYGVYTVTVTSAAGCTVVSDPFTVSSVVDLQANIVGATAACQQDIVTLSAVVDYDLEGHTYKWLVNNQYITDAHGISGSTTAHLTFPVDSLYTYYGEVLANEFTVEIYRTGCATPVVSPVHPFLINPVPYVYIAAPEKICNGADLTLEAIVYQLGANAQYQYVWFKNGNAFDTIDYINTITLEHGTFTATDQFAVQVIYQDIACNSDTSAAVTVPFYVEPQRDTLNMDPSTICTSNQASVWVTDPNTDPDNFGDVTYTWYVNGFVSPLAQSDTLVVDFDHNGAYTFWATASYANYPCAISYTDTLTENVVMHPTVMITGDPIICNDSILNLYAIINDTVGSLDYTYEWRLYNSTLHDGINTIATSSEINHGNIEFEVASSDTLLTIGHMPAQEFPYVFTVVITTPQGCRVESDPYYVYVGDSIHVVATVDYDSVCAQGMITATAHLGNWNLDNLTAQWQKRPYVQGAGEDENWVNIPWGTSGIVQDVTGVTSEYRIVVTQTSTGCVGKSNPVYVKVFAPYSIHHVVAINHDSNFPSDTVCEGAQLDVVAYLTKIDPSTGNPVQDTLPDGSYKFDDAGNPVYQYYIDSTLTYMWKLNGMQLQTVHGPSFSAQAYIYDGDPVDYTYTAYIVYDIPGCDMIPVASNTIHVKRNPVVIIEGNHNFCYFGPTFDNVNLTAWVDGDYDPDATYNWFKNGEDRTGHHHGYDNHYRERWEPSYDNPYEFVVEVTNGDGCTSRSDIHYVNIYDKPFTHITASADSICENGSVTMQANLENYNDPMLTFQWYRDVINNSHIIPGATHEIETFYPELGTTKYIVEVMHLMDYEQTCIAYDTFQIKVNAIPVVTAVNDLAGHDTICEGRTVAMHATTTGGVPGGEVYTWYRNGELIANNSTDTLVDAPVAIDNEPTSYVYSVEVRQSASGCESVVYTFANPVVVLPNPALELTTDPIVCIATGNNITLTANMVPTVVGSNLTYAWYEDNHILNGFPTPTTENTISFNKPYRDYPYSFSVKTVNDYGCVSEASATVYVNDTPVVNITATETEICNGGEITLTASLEDWNADQLTFQWYDGATAIAGATSLSYTVVPTQGTHKYTIQIDQLTSLCHATSDTLVVNVNADPTVVLNYAAAQYTVCDGYQVDLTTTVTDGVAGGEVYTWYRNGQVIEGATEATYSEVVSALNGEPTTYNYAVSVAQTAAGCESNVYDQLQTITVNPNPVLVLTTDPIVCNENGDNITLTANLDPSTVGSNVTYYWMEDNHALAGFTTPTVANTISFHKDYRDYPYSFAVQVVNDYACSATAEAQVLVNDTPVVNITVTESEICVGGEITLTATLNDWNADMLTFQWYDGNTAIAGATELSYTVVPALGTHKYTVQVDQLTSLCHATSDTITVTVNPDPVIATVVPSQLNVCYGGQLAITATPEDGYKAGEVYTWYRNGILMEGATAATIYDTPGTVDNNTQTYVYTAVVTRPEAGCTSLPVSSATVTVYPNPVVVITGDQHVCETDSVFLIANVDTTAFPVGTLHFTWYESGQIRDNMAYGLGDNSFYAEYFYARTEPYRFTVTASRLNDATGCIATSNEFLVYVYPQPVVNVTASETQICTNGEVTLTANLNDYNAENIVYQWYEIRYHDVTYVIGYDENDQYVDTTVTVPYHYNIPGATMPTYTTNLTESTTLGVMVLQTNSSCWSNDEIEIIVNPIPVVTAITVSDDTVCDGAQVTVTATVNPNGTSMQGAVYAWYRNGILIPGATGASFSENVFTTDNHVTVNNYTATVTLIPSGCVSEMSAAGTVVINPAPTTVSISGISTICENDSTTLTAYSDVEGEWTWSTGSHASSIIVPAGTYTVTMKTVEGCEMTSEPFTVEAFGTDLLVSASATSICRGEHTTLYVNQDGWQGNVTYAWDAQAGNSTATTVDVQPDSTTTYHVTATVNSTNGSCTAEGEVTIIVNQLPAQFSVTASAQTICEGQQVTFTAPVDPQVTSYIWYQNGIEIPGENQNVITINFNEAGQYTLAAKAISVEGCVSAEASAPVTITVTPAPSTVSITGINVLCQNDSTILTAHSDVPGTFTWNDGTIGATNVVTEGVYNVTITTAEGCSMTSENFTVESFGTDLLVSASATSICQGEHTTLYVDQDGWQANVTYAWDAQAGNSTASTVDVQPMATTTYHVTATVTSNNGSCTAEGEVTIIVNPLPVISSVTASNTTICEGDQVTFTATGDANTTAYVWYANGVEIPGENQAVLTVNFNEAGNYQYSVKAISNENCLAAVAVDAPAVTVKPAPTTVTITGINVLCQNDSTVLTAHSDVAGTFTWNDGTIGATKVVTEGVYNVTLTTPEGCHMTSENFTVESFGTDLLVSASATSICQGEHTTLYVDQDGWVGNVTYAWDAQAGNSTASTVDVQPMATTTYHVTATVTSNNGSCTAAGEVTIIVNPLPVVTAVTASNTTICEGDQVTFTATGDANTTAYVWYANGVEIPGENQAVLTVNFNEAGNYQYSVKAISNENCLAAVAVDAPAVTVKPAPTTVTITGINVLCQNDSTVLTAHSDVAGTFTWNDGTIGATKVVTEGVYNVTLTTAEGCHMTSENFTVESFGTDLIVSATETNICEGEHTTLSVDQNGWQGNVTYEWSTGSNATTIDVQPDTTTTYTVTATVTSTNGVCTAVGEITINVNPRPATPIVAVSADTICTGSQFAALIVQGYDNMHVIWYKDGEVVPGENMPQLILNAESGLHTIAARVVSDEGCISNVSLPYAIFNNNIVTAYYVGIDAPESVTISASSTTICNGGTSTLVANVDPNMPATYAWFKDGVAIINANTPTIDVTTAGSYTVEAAFHGCSTVSAPVVITVEQAPQLQLTATETSICPSGVTVITAEATGWNNADVNYEWSCATLGNNFSFEGSSYTFTAPYAGTFTFAVTASQATSGCEAVDQITITVNPIPATPVVTVDNATICDGGQVTLTVTNASNLATYTWRRNGVIIPNATTATLTESPVTVDGDVTNYVYTVVAELPMSGCTSLTSANTVVTVIPTPVVAVAVEGNTTICEGGSTTLHANVTPAANYNYQWYKDNVLIEGAVADTYVAAELARETAYNYTVVVTANPGCNVTSAATAITFVADPVVEATISNNISCVGGTATLTAIVDGGVDNVNGLNAYTFEWYRNNPNPSDPNNPYSTQEFVGNNATYTTSATDAPGNYTYWVTVTSNYGCQSTSEVVNYSVIADPVVTIAVATGYPTTVCNGGETMLKANVSGGYGTSTYQWYKNGNILVGETSQTLMLVGLQTAANDNYMVEVTQTGVGCANNASINLNTLVTVNPTYTVDITGFGNVCEGGTLTLNATVNGVISGDVVTYQWYRVTNGDDAIAIAGANNAQYSTSDLLLGSTYDYYVVVTSSISGCSVVSNSVPANVVAAPTVAIQGANTVCEGGNLTLNAFVSGGVDGAAYTYTWNWTGAANGSATTNVPTYVPTLTANDLSTPYYFTVTISRNDNTGCEATSAAHEVNVLAVPTVSVTADNSYVCENGLVTFTAHVTPVGSYNYVWTINGQQQAVNAATVTTSLGTAGSINASVVVSAANASASCSATATIATPVVVVAAPTVALTATNTAMCVGGVTTLTATVNANPNIPQTFNYEWIVDGGTPVPGITNTLNQTLTTAGVHTYQVRVSQNNNLGCASNWSNIATVQVAEQPVVTLTSEDGLSICEGGSITLTGIVTNFGNTVNGVTNSNIYGTLTFDWTSNGVNVHHDTSSNAMNQVVETLNTIGNYTYQVAVTPSGYNCQPQISNEYTVEVVNNPTWTDVHVYSNNGTDACLGEMVTLMASIEGGAFDGSGITGGHIQWVVTDNLGNTIAVDGGLGGSSYDIPDAPGLYVYTPTFVGNIGNGCQLANTNDVQVAVTVHELPTAEFTSGDGTALCANDPSASAQLVITFTGVAPFTYEVVDDHNNVVAHATTMTNNATIYVAPDHQTTYRINLISDNYCTNPAVGDAITATVYVNEIQFADNFFVSGCNDNNQVTISFNMISGNPTAAFTVVYENGLTDNGNISNNTATFAVPTAPGDYNAVFTVDGCDYDIVVRVLVGDYGFGGTLPIMDQRWNDVVVVNNNPANNGGHTFVGFQWYHNGVAIPGATYSNYQDKDGLNGFYSVELTEMDANGNMITYRTCEMYFNSTSTVKVYPVPANVRQEITIELELTSEELEGAVLDIYSVTGAHISHVTDLQPITKIEGFKAQGTYFGRILTGTNEIKTVKFIIVK